MKNFNEWVVSYCTKFGKFSNKKISRRFQKEKYILRFSDNLLGVSLVDECGEEWEEGIFNGATGELIQFESFNEEEEAWNKLKKKN